MEDPLAQRDGELANAIQTVSPVTSYEDLSDETRAAIVPAGSPPEVTWDPLGFAYRPHEEPPNLTLWDRVLRSLGVAPRPSARPDSVGQDPALQAIHRAEQRYAALQSVYPTVVGAVETLKQSYSEVACYVEALREQVRAIQQVIDRGKSDVEALNAERGGLRRDLGAPGLLASLRDHVGTDGLRACVSTAEKRYEDATRGAARWHRELRFLAEEAEFAESRLEACRQTLNYLDAAIEVAAHQLRDLDRTLDYYRLPVRAEARATVALLFLQRVDALDEGLKTASEQVNLNLGRAVREYVSKVHPWDVRSPIPSDDDALRV